MPRPRSSPTGSAASSTSRASAPTSATGPGSVRTGCHDVEQHLNEAAAEALGARITHLRPAFYMENDLRTAAPILEQGAVPLPVAGERQVPMVATDDVAVEAVRQLAFAANGGAAKPLARAAGPDASTRRPEILGEAPWGGPSGTCASSPPRRARRWRRWGSATTSPDGRSRRCTKASQEGRLTAEGPAHRRGDHADRVPRLLREGPGAGDPTCVARPDGAWVRPEAGRDARKTAVRSPRPPGGDLKWAAAG